MPVSASDGNFGRYASGRRVLARFLLGYRAYIVPAAHQCNLNFNKPPGHWGAFFVVLFLFARESRNDGILTRETSSPSSIPWLSRLCLFLEYSSSAFWFVILLGNARQRSRRAAGTFISASDLITAAHRRVRSPVMAQLESHPNTRLLRCFGTVDPNPALVRIWARRGGRNSPGRLVLKEVSANWPGNGVMGLLCSSCTRPGSPPQAGQAPGNLRQTRRRQIPTIWDVRYTVTPRSSPGATPLLHAAACSVQYAVVPCIYASEKWSADRLSRVMYTAGRSPSDQPGTARPSGSGQKPKSGWHAGHL